MKHAYALRKFNRVGPRSGSRDTIDIPAFSIEIGVPPDFKEVIAEFERSIRASQPGFEEIGRNIAHACRGLNR